MNFINKRTSSWILLLVAFLWGSGFITAHFALNTGLSPYYITAIRFIIATALFYAFCFKRLKNLRPLLLPGFILGVFLSTAFIFQTVGLQFTTPSKNAFITAINVVFTPIIAVLISRKRISMRLSFSVLLVIIGIGFLTLDKITGFNLGDFLTLICALLFALHIYFIGFFVRSRNYDLYKIIFLQFLFAAIIGSAFALFLGDFQIPGRQGLIMLLYQGIFSTLIGFVLQNSAQRHVPQTKAALLLSCEAAFGTIMSVLIVKEVLTLSMISGFILMLIGIIIAELGQSQ